MEKTVIVVERILIHYRVPFYALIREILKEKGIKFNLIYGQGDSSEIKKQDTVDLPWATKIQNTYFPLKLFWQPYLSLVKNADLLIIDQAFHSLSNYLAVIQARHCKQKIAFWGFSRNYRVPCNSFRNIIKKIYNMKCDWWFCYTENEKKNIEKNGFPPNCITSLQNSIDTRTLMQISATISPEDIETLRNKENIGKGPVAIYCGGIYKEKRIDFLLQACRRIRERIPTFELIIIGAGADVHEIIDEVNQHNWIHYAGPRFGREKTLYFKMADIFLLPGLVGLAILDSFVMGVPLITMKNASHGPEIEYLINGENGLMTEDSQNVYVEEVVRVLNNQTMLKSMKIKCVESVKLYTIENMVQNFIKGVCSCLQVNL